MSPTSPDRDESDLHVIYHNHDFLQLWRDLRTQQSPSITPLSSATTSFCGCPIIEPRSSHTSVKSSSIKPLIILQKEVNAIKILKSLLYDLFVVIFLIHLSILWSHRHAEGILSSITPIGNIVSLRRWLRLPPWAILPDFYLNRLTPYVGTAIL